MKKLLTFAASCAAMLCLGNVGMLAGTSLPDDYKVIPSGGAGVTPVSGNTEPESEPVKVLDPPVIVLDPEDVVEVEETNDSAYVRLDEKRREQILSLDTAELFRYLGEQKDLCNTVRRAVAVANDEFASLNDLLVANKDIDWVRYIVFVQDVRTRFSSAIADRESQYKSFVEQKPEATDAAADMRNALDFMTEVLNRENATETQISDASIIVDEVFSLYASESSTVYSEQLQELQSATTRFSNTINTIGFSDPTLAEHSASVLAAAKELLQEENAKYSDILIMINKLQAESDKWNVVTFIDILKTCSEYSWVMQEVYPDIEYMIKELETLVNDENTTSFDILNTLDNTKEELDNLAEHDLYLGSEVLNAAITDRLNATMFEAMELAYSAQENNQPATAKRIMNAVKAYVQNLAEHPEFVDNDLLEALANIGANADELERENEMAINMAEKSKAYLERYERYADKDHPAAEAQALDSVLNSGMYTPIDLAYYVFAFFTLDPEEDYYATGLRQMAYIKSIEQDFPEIAKSLFDEFIESGGYEQFDKDFIDPAQTEIDGIYNDRIDDLHGAYHAVRKASFEESPEAGSLKYFYEEEYPQAGSAFKAAIDKAGKILEGETTVSYGELNRLCNLLEKYNEIEIYYSQRDLAYDKEEVVKYTIRRWIDKANTYIESIVEEHSEEANALDNAVSEARELIGSEDPYPLLPELYEELDNLKNTMRETKAAIAEAENEVITNIEEQKVADAENALWYDLSGKPLAGKPTAKGLYIFGGKLVLVK